MKRVGLIKAVPFALMLLAAFCSSARENMPGLALIPAGAFEMGDHHGFVDPRHGGDETPVHTVRLDSFYMGVNTVTTGDYCEFLNAALAEGRIEVRNGWVYLAGGRDLLCDTRVSSQHSGVGWDGKAFAALDRKESHPMVCVRWHGAAAYCNWLSAKNKLPLCYDTVTWSCDFNKSGYRLPTEAEWEYAARGGRRNPYFNYPWGNDADPARANVPESRNPFRVGRQPWTTPVGFFNGKTRLKADFDWPGARESFQTSDGANGYGLYDMAGNVWQWCGDWYERSYYAHSPGDNPPGPAKGSLMPDGKTYRCMRGGSWYNGEFGHSRVSNRDPSYFRGPDPVTGLNDPDGPWFHIGFRVALPVNAESRPVVKATAADRVSERENDPEGGSNVGDSRSRRQQREPSQEDRAGWGDRQSVFGGRTADRGSLAEACRKPISSFALRSGAVADGGNLPAEFTADGASATLPLEWSGAPAGTKSYAVVMHHEAPDQTKWYWILYDIPADTQSLPKNAKGIGALGGNSVNKRAEYAPPRSKGPGAKTYVYTVYALSAPPRIDSSKGPADRETLLAAIKDSVLASAELSVVYSRLEGAAQQGEDRGQGIERSRNRPGGDGEDRSGDRPRRTERLNEDRGPGIEGSRNRPGGDGEDQPGDRSRRPERFNEGRESGREGGGGGGRRDMPENKTPVSQIPGQTVGLFLNTEKACPGYTLFAPKHNTVTYLMGNDGRVVHQWKSDYEPGQSAYLLTNGHLVRAGMVKVQGGTGGGEGGRIEEYDWDGNLVWEFNHATRDYQLHHDFKPLPNGNILALMVERKSRDEAVAAGFDGRQLRDDFLVPDAVVEIEPVRPKGGRIVWEWHVWDHLIQNNDPARANYGDPSAHPELVDVACNGRSTPAFWNHMNSLDYNPALDQIALSARGCNEIWIIDHSATTREAAGHSGGRHGRGGDLIYRWGNPAAYGRGGDRQLVQQHDALWVPAGSPGAGNITIFNNGYDRGWSSIEEIVPPLDASGRYVIESGKAFGPDKPVWRYEAKKRTDFFSPEISGAHRLPNGNMLVCAGITGHLFEITPSGEMVWQYVNPMVRGGILAQGELPGKDMRGHLWNAVFKVHRYPPDYPGLAGRDLTPKGVVELPASMKGKTGLDRMTEQQRPDRRAGGSRRESGDSGGGGNRSERPPRNDKSSDRQ